MSSTMSQDQALELPISPTKTNILNLNFDCLYTIFSFDGFTKMDLCSIAETHSIFKEAVVAVFVKRYKNYNMVLSTTTELDTSRTRRILTNFGSHISSLSMDGRSIVNEKSIPTLDLVIEHCSNSLESLKLVWLRIYEHQASKLKRLFDKLQKISVQFCYIAAGKALLSNCESLNELILDNVMFGDDDLAFENIFPELDRFEYRCTYTYAYFGDAIWNNFFSRHQKLKALRLIRYGGFLLQLATDNCKHLAELDFAIAMYIDHIDFENSLGCILTLEHLNKLKIRCAGQNITKFTQRLKYLKSLHILSFNDVEFDSELIPALSKLQRLQVLELRLCKGLTNLNQLADLEGLTELKIVSKVNLVFDLLSMIRRITNLRTLKLNVRSFKIDRQMYLQIVDVVRGRIGKFAKTLQISCYTANDGSMSSPADEDCGKIVTLIEY